MQRTRIVGCGAVGFIVAAALLVCGVHVLCSLLPRHVDDGLIQAVRRQDDNLVRAVMTGDNQQLKALIESGADVHAKYSFRFDNGYWGELIHLACEMGHPETVRLLIEAGSGVDAPDGLGQTPLVRMASSDRRPDQPRCAEVLASAGANLEATAGWEGYNALHGCALLQNVPLATMLLALGANVNAADQHGDTPLHLTCNTPPNEHPCEAMIRLLIRNRASLETRNMYGKTPADLMRDRNLMNLLSGERDRSEGDRKR